MAEKLLGTGLKIRFKNAKGFSSKVTYLFLDVME
jgi:hypothetical protein